MEQHLSPTALARLLTGQTAAAEAEIADSHMARCLPCQDLAAAVAADLRRQGEGIEPPDPPNGRSGVLLQLEAEERTLQRRLLAHTGWAELEALAMEEQLARLEREPVLQTLEMFQTVLAAASAVARDNPLRGEERAFVACALAGLLPGECCAEAVRHDLRGEAMLVVTDCRRRAGAGSGATEALKTAQTHFNQGTGDPVCEARVLAVQAALALDAGRPDRAQFRLSRAAKILHVARNPAAVAAVKIQEAEALLAAGRFEEGLARAEEALHGAPPSEARLHMQARGLTIECLAGLGRPAEALRSFLAAGPRDEQLGDRLGALVLAALDRESASAADPRPAGWSGPQPSPPEGLFDAAMEGLESQLIAVGLAQCEGCILETTRLLGFARNTLRAKIKRYRLAGEAHPLDLSEDETRALERLRARSWWNELRMLPAVQQIERLAETPAWQTREMLDTVVAAAAAGAQEDPWRGEETALVAQALAGLLPRSACPEPLRHDLLGDGLMVIGNCRRLSGDWSASAAAFAEARGHLDQGTGDRRREARLLSLQASLASDTGKLEQALGLLAHAISIYRKVQDPLAIASTTLKEAGAFLAAGRYEDAMARAERALRGLSAREARLEMLARSILTECLAVLGRSTEALRSLAATWPLFEQLGGRRSEPQVRFLEGLVLDAHGNIREAEAAYGHSIAGYVEAGLFKDAFLTMLTWFESLVRRGAWDRAARACVEALALEEQIGAPGHGPMIGLWRDLLTLATGQRLTEQRVLAARQAVIRHWGSPEPGARSESPGTTALRWDGNGATSPLLAASPPAARDAPKEPEPPVLAIEPPPLPPLPDRLADGEFQEILESYERQLIEAALAQGSGKIKTAARLLGISKTAVQAKVRKYRLKVA